MGNQLSQALADAGLVPQVTIDKQIVQECTRNLCQQRKAQRKRDLQTHDGCVENFASPAKFMEAARQRLKEQGYSRDLMKSIFHDAHKFADAKLTRKHRNRMHAFLCQVQEKLESSTATQQQRILRDGKRAFKQMNAKNL